MISATSNWITANAAKKKQPSWLIKIEGYRKAFTSRSGVSSIGSLAVDPTVQSASKVVDFGGLGFVPSTATLPKATPAGNLIFAFLLYGGSTAPAITDDAGNTWTQIYHAGYSGGGSNTVWYTVANAWAAGNNVTWDPSGTFNHHSAEFFVVEVPASYSSFTTGSNTGSIIGTPADLATCTVGANDVSFSLFGFTFGGGWSIVQVALAQATTTTSGINICLFQTNPVGPGTPAGTILGAAASVLVSTTTAVTYDWIVTIDPLSITVADLDGGADLADLVFNIQDNNNSITADLASFTFEGKIVQLLEGYVGLGLADYLVRFTGKISTVLSDNANLEYKFTCPDIRADLTKVIFQTGDDGFAISSDHPRTLLGNPIDLLLDALENEVGYSASVIDVAFLTTYRDTILSGYEFEFTLTSAPAAKDFIENEILKPLGGYHFTNNLGVIKFHFFYPIAPVSVDTLDHTSMLDVELAGQADLVNQVSWKFDQQSDGSTFESESIQQFGPSITKYGLFGEQVIESAGLRSAFQGFFLAAFISRLLFLRYGSKQLLIDGMPNSWDHSLLEPGDIVSLTTSLAPDRVAGTMGITAKTFEVMDRTWDFIAGVVTLKLLEIDLTAFKQYLITPNAEADFTADSPTNQAKYLYLSDAAGVYSGGSPANTMC